jgi:CBS domain-containing protein
VYDYVAGKADWGAAGLPLDGTLGPRAGEHVRRDVPTCRLDERLPDVQERVRAGGWDTCVVVSEGGVVLGRLGREALRSTEDVSAEEAMTAGPGTVRPSVTLARITSRMQQRGLSGVLVTRSDGTLVGLLLRADAERALERQSASP